MTTASITTQDIANAIAERLNADMNIAIEITARGARGALPLWTVSGQPEDVDAAVSYLTGLRLMTEESRETFADTGEAFSYLAS